MVEKQEITFVKVKAKKGCKISKDNKSITYVFKKDEVQEINKDHLNLLLDTGLFIEVKK